MKSLLIAIFTIFAWTFTFAQSFEGKLTYKVEFDMKVKKIGKIEITKEQVLDKMKKEGEYFDTLVITLKNGNYKKEDNSNSRKKIVYKSDVNKIYTFQKDFDHVVITDAKKKYALNLKLPEPTFEKTDSLKVVNGYNCKLVKLSWDKLGEEYYFYNSEVVKLDAQLFKNHNNEYFNNIIEISNSYPIEIIKTVMNFITIKMTLIKISEEKILDDEFKLPKFEKAEKDYAEMMLKITGSEVMKIRE
jgi:hypothetical protein